MVVMMMMMMMMMMIIIIIIIIIITIITKPPTAYREPKLMDDPRVFPRCQPEVVLALGTGLHHLARGGDEGGGAWVTDPHDNSRESLGTVLGITCVEGDVL